MKKGEKTMIDLKKLVIITIGGNDHTYVKLPVYRSELTRLAEELKSRNTLPIIQTYYSATVGASVLKTYCHFFSLVKTDVFGVSIRLFHNNYCAERQSLRNPGHIGYAQLIHIIATTTSPADCADPELIAASWDIAGT